VGGAVDDRCTELQGRALEGVPRADLVDLGRARVLGHRANLARRLASSALPESSRHTVTPVIFKAVGDSRPYPDHGYTTRQWSTVPPRLVRLDELVTTKRELDLQMLLSEDSTFYGDLFAHVVEWEGSLYLEDGLHRALRAALHQRPTLHARVLAL
jgi:Arc/MetJ family transcription regulator